MEPSKLFRSAAVVGSLTLLSRFLGMIRDLLTAGMFGTSMAMSAFVVAFRIPNLFRRLFGEGALSSAFVPVFVEVRNREGASVGWRLANRVVSLAAVVLTVLTVLGIGATYLLQTGAEDPTQRDLILSLTRIMLPYMILICLVALCMGILNALHHFATPAFTPSLLNVVWIVVVVAVCPFLGDSLETRIHGLAWGILVAGVIQLGIQVPVLRRFGFRFRPSLHVRDPRVWRVLMLMGPASIGLAVTQVNVMVNSLLAAWIGPWAPAALFYSERLLYFPQGILATAMSTVLLPVFSGQMARAEGASMLHTMNRSLRVLWFVMAPAAAGLFVLARPIVQMLFEWGRFDAASTGLTTLALQCYAPGLVVFSLAKIFVPAFYARQDPMTPVRIGLLSVGVNLGLNLVFLVTLPLYWKHAGLAFSTVIAEALNGILLGRMVHRKMGSPGWGEILGSGARALAAALAMAGAIALLEPGLRAALGGLDLPAKMMQVLLVVLLIVTGMAVFAAAAFAFRCPELKELTGAIRRRIGAPRRSDRQP